MSTGKDSKDKDDLEEDSTFSHIDEAFEELGDDSASVPFNLEMEDSGIYSDTIDTDQDPKDFLAELDLDSNTGSDDLNDMLRDLEAGTEDSQLADEFENELVELSQDDMLPENEVADLEAAADQQQFSFDEQDELESEDDTQQEPSFDKTDEDSNRMEELLSDMETDPDSPKENTEVKEAEEVAIDSEETISGFQPMNGDDDSNLLTEMSDELSADSAAHEKSADASDTNESKEKLRELNDDELDDVLGNASFTEVDNGDIPDSELTHTVISPDEDNHEEVSSFGEELYAKQDDADPPEIATHELPESDEADLPSHVGVDMSNAESSYDTDLKEQEENPIDSNSDISDYTKTAGQSNNEHHEEVPSFIGEEPPVDEPASGHGGGSMALAILGMVVAIGGASGFWYTTKIGGDLDILKEDVLQLKNQIMGLDGGGVKREDVEQLRDNLFALEKQVKKPINELRSTVNQQLSKTNQRIRQLEQDTSSLDQRFENLEAQGSMIASGSTGKGGSPTMVSLEPRFAKIDKRIEGLQETLQSLRKSIVSSTNPKQTTELKKQLSTLTQQVMELKKRIGKGERIMAKKGQPSKKTATTLKPAKTAQVAKSTAKMTDETSPQAAEKMTESAAKTGLWGINLRSYASRALAEKGLIELKAKELDAVIQEAEVSGKTWYRLRLEGFASSHEAKKYIKEQLANAGFTGAWISKSK